MLKLFGPSSYTKEQHKQLLKKLGGEIDNILHIDTGYMYCLDVPEPYDPKVIQLLTSFLNLPSVLYQPKKVPGETAIVLPKEGVLSSWGSAAVDFLHRLGLSDVTLFERGVVFYIETNYGQPFDENDFSLLVNMISDEDRDMVCRDALAVNNHYLGKSSLLPIQIPLLEKGKASLEEVNAKYLLNLSADDLTFLDELYVARQRNPNMIEIMTYAIIQSEHCSHSIFQANWFHQGNQEAAQETLFSLLNQSQRESEEQPVGGFAENAAILKEVTTTHFSRDARTQLFDNHEQATYPLHKLEMHNQVCQFDPLRGAAVGVGSELGGHSVIGQGSFPDAGMVGFCVSHLKMERFVRPWEDEKVSFPEHIASPARIALQAPIGAAQFNNAFGRPTVGGFFRTFEFQDDKAHNNRHWGFHQPLIMSSGLGRVAKSFVYHDKVLKDAPIVVIGRPSMRMGLAGCIMASQSFQNRQKWIDYATVYHDYPEMQRRCQEIINLCCSLGEENPIAAIKDVSSGGLANAIVKLVHACDKGAYINLANVPVLGNMMRPWEVWSNETQERYILIAKPSGLQELQRFAAREHVMCVVIGHVTEEQDIVVEGYHDKISPILEMRTKDLIDRSPEVQKNVLAPKRKRERFDPTGVDLAEAARRVLQLPAVADKTCFVTIADRSVGGHVARGPMVGPWQTPVSDVAVVCHSSTDYQGQAMALGERVPVAVIDTSQSVSLACSEAITNLMAADVASIEDIHLGMSWIGANDEEGSSHLYQGVSEFVEKFALELGIPVVTGDDALSMYTNWKDDKDNKHEVVAPVTAIVTATASIKDVRNTLTPELNRALAAESKLLYIDLAQEEKGLGGTALAQVYGSIGAIVTQVRDPGVLKNFIAAMAKLRHLVMAYHDCSDGGLFVTILEMCIASRMGAQVHLNGLAETPLLALFHEGPGVVIQVMNQDAAKVASILEQEGLANCLHEIGRASEASNITFLFEGEVCLKERRMDWHRLWSLTSSHIKQMRDDPDCAREAYNALLNAQDPGLHAKVTFPIEKINHVENLVAEYGRPKVAICREQGCHGYLELALAFKLAGFMPIDVTMTDLQAGRDNLASYVGVAFSGGYSCSDIGGAGKAWSYIILEDPKLRAMFSDFFSREDTFTLGIGNGAQLLTYLRSLIAGTDHWPYFHLNRSLQFESRLSLVQVEKTNSVFFSNMEGCILPVPVAHCEGRAAFPVQGGLDDMIKQSICLRYVNHFDYVADYYPANPSGSELSAAGVTSKDGRVTLLMPRPERVIRSVNMAWHPDSWQDYTPWLRMFCNAREWVGSKITT
jgi:phosphoribosylformylglycinamidine synthase